VPLGMAASAPVAAVTCAVLAVGDAAALLAARAVTTSGPRQERW